MGKRITRVILLDDDKRNETPLLKGDKKYITFKTDGSNNLGVKTEFMQMPVPILEMMTVKWPGDVETQTPKVFYDDETKEKIGFKETTQSVQAFKDTLALVEVKLGLRPGIAETPATLFQPHMPELNSEEQDVIARSIKNTSGDAWPVDLEGGLRSVLQERESNSLSSSCGAEVSSESVSLTSSGTGIQTN